MLTTSSWVPGLTPAEGYEANGWQSAALISSLAVIALGTGGIKPNVAAFGADQFNETDPQVGTGGGAAGSLGQGRQGAGAAGRRGREHW